MIYIREQYAQIIMLNFYAYPIRFIIFSVYFFVSVTYKFTQIPQKQNYI